MAHFFFSLTSPGGEARKEENWVELHLRERAWSIWEIIFILNLFIYHPSWHTHATFDTSCISVVFGQIWAPWAQRLSISQHKLAKNVHNTVSLMLKLTSAIIFWYNSTPVELYQLHDHDSKLYLFQMLHKLKELNVVSSPQTCPLLWLHNMEEGWPVL